jgi:hypothetical protein
VFKLFPEKFEAKVGGPDGLGAGVPVPVAVGDGLKGATTAGWGATGCGTGTFGPPIEPVSGWIMVVLRATGRADAGPVAAHISPVAATVMAASKRFFIGISPPRRTVTRQRLNHLHEPWAAL